MTDDATPASFAAEALGTGVDAINYVEPIKQGLTNRSWVVYTGAEAVVVRISEADESQLRIDRRSEALILNVVAAAGIGPPVLLCDPARRVLVTEYLGPTWSIEQARGKTEIVRLAQILRRLHDLDVPAGIVPVDLPATVDGYVRTLDERGSSSGLTVPSVRECAMAMAQQLGRNALVRLCHNDVHHLNIVADGDVRLIDWEYAGAGDPFFDLASVCVYHRYDREQRERLLWAYAPDSDASAWYRLELACWLFDYIRDLWMAIRFSSLSASQPPQQQP
jgi:thiamine kinase